MNKTKSYNRIPHEYFITKGCGESDYQVHAGCYHVALYNAKICNYNIQTYSSILPKDAIEINIDSVDISFGSELYTIMSCLHGTTGEYLSCGIVIGDLIQNDNKIGSLVCEVTNKDKNINIKDQLNDAIFDLHKNTYEQCTLNNLRYLTNDIEVTKKYGTCLVSLCFYSFFNV